MIENSLLKKLWGTIPPMILLKKYNMCGNLIIKLMFIVINNDFEVKIFKKFRIVPVIISFSVFSYLY
jgi:hypothetical protein